MTDFLAGALSMYLATGGLMLWSALKDCGWPRSPQMRAQLAQAFFAWPTLFLRQS